jgi:hypothetical protein
MLFLQSSKSKLNIKMNKKQRKNTLRKKTFKANEISTFPPPRSVPRPTPDDQNHPRGAPGPPQDTLKKPSVFSVPPGPSPRTPWGLPGTPPATPRDPPMTPRDPQGTPNTPQGPPPRFGPAECAERSAAPCRRQGSGRAESHGAPQSYN